MFPKIEERNHSGSVLILAIVVMAILSVLFLGNQSRFTNVTKSMSKTINSNGVNAKLLEVRSFLTNKEICESSLKGFLINQNANFNLQSSSGLIDLSESKFKIINYKFISLANTGDVRSGRIGITIESLVNAKTITNTYSIDYNFYIDTATLKIKECLGEKTDESDELLQVTVVEKRKEICNNALNGTIQNGKCVWAW